MTRRHPVTVTDSEPHALRDDALQRLITATDGDAGFYYSVYDRDGVRYLGDAAVAGPSGGDLALVNVVGVPIPAGAAGSPEIDRSGRRHRWDVRIPLRRQRNRFLLLDDDLDRAAFERTPVWHAFYGPASIGDHLRALIYDGDVFVGWVGVFRQGRRERFSRTIREAVQHQLADLRALIVAAHQVELERTSGGAGYAVFDARGQLLYASGPARAYLRPHRLGMVQTLVRQLDAGSEAASPSVMFGAMQLQVVRLDAADGVRYLAILGLASRPRLSSIAALSPMQRVVADYAAAGATVEEIAATVESSPNTVKHHLKAIYRGLGVASRAELARLWVEEVG
ncbi:MAG: hypothetical protein SangKO_027930 [Sandaracinaceae bacterium]